MRDYEAAIIREITITGRTTKKPLRSIFIGGGTPSYMHEKAIEQILAAVKESFVLKPDCEITMEMNPGTITPYKASVYKRAGINRVSLGLQSTHNHHLQTLGRIHTFEQFVENFEILRNLGFDNINVDLMSGLPGLTLLEWEETLKTIIELNPEHISAYSLIIEPETPFYGLYESGEGLPEESIEREMYWLTHDLLKTAGYEHYEISNFAKRGKCCVHNKSYWQMEDYMGVGLGAASYHNGIRYKNSSDLDVYLDWKGQLSEIRTEVEEVELEQGIEEFMFLGLRLLIGIRKDVFEHLFEMPIEAIYGQVIDQLKSKQLLRENKESLRLTRKGIDLANQVFVEFLEIKA